MYPPETVEVKVTDSPTRIEAESGLIETVKGGGGALTSICFCSTSYKPSLSVRFNVTV